jgi:peroxiredoxin
MKTSVRTVLLSVCLLVYVELAVSQNTVDCTVKDRPANFDFTLIDMHGDKVHLGDYRGQVLLLDFWATWCGPCRIEIPGFIELLDKYEEQGLAILGISVDDPVDALLFYAEEMQMDYPVLIGDGRDDVKESYGPLIGFPTTVLIDRDGNICHSHAGFAPKEQFEAEIRSLF